MCLRGKFIEEEVALLEIRSVFIQALCGNVAVLRAKNAKIYSKAEVEKL